MTSTRLPIHSRRHVVLVWLEIHNLPTRSHLSALPTLRTHLISVQQLLVRREDQGDSPRAEFGQSKGDKATCAAVVQRSSL